VKVTRYARSGDAHIAYQVSGDGSVDILLTSYSNISIDAFEREPHLARFLERMRTFARVILFDPRGVGLSDPVSRDSPPTLEQAVADAIAVLDAAGSARAVPLAIFSRGPRSVLLAATHPDRTQGLVLCNAFARMARAPDYPWGLPLDEMMGTISSFGEPETQPAEEPPDGDEFLAMHVPTLVHDRAFRTWWDLEGRRGASPSSAVLLNSMDMLADVRDVLPTIRVPTLVLHRRSGMAMDLSDHGRYLAERIPGAKHVELDGTGIYPFVEDADRVLAEIAEFVTGEPPVRDVTRVLATIMFTDIVGSTELAVAAGDATWKRILNQHDEMVRRQISRFGGREVKTTGDGFLVTFDGPTDALRAALAIRDGAGQLGVQVRAGVHTGEIELRDGDIGGVAVHLAQRVSALAPPDAVLVSSTVKDLALGSGIEFEEGGTTTLKGLPGTWQLYQIRD